MGKCGEHIIVSAVFVNFGSPVDGAVHTVFDGIEDKLMAVDGIIRVRVIK
jgi:hypothetical protein